MPQLEHSICCTRRSLVQACSFAARVEPLVKFLLVMLSQVWAGQVVPYP